MPHATLFPPAKQHAPQICNYCVTLSKNQLGLKGTSLPTPTISRHSLCTLATSTLLSLSVGLGAASAQVVIAPAKPKVGSSNPVTAEPQVSRPSTRPCVVKLLKDASFIGFDGVPMSYAPPAACPGPWAKVVLTVDLTVSAGRQFDRTAEFILGGANIFYGTTAEPRKALSPSWHVERDVTDLSAIFKKAQTGKAEIGNVVDSTYTGIIYANAALEFYPASFSAPAPAVPEVVVPVNGSGGDAGAVNSGQQITQVLNLPTNTSQVFLDVIAQSQSSDEFWYLCVPSDQAGNLESCGNTAFRETEVTIDGKPAGVAPVYPWIYTGGLDPYLWEPITGVQTLDFKPYRVNLTPFAGLLSDGEPHTIGIGVYNADSYFLVTGNVLAFTDNGRKHTGGEVLSNTLTLNPTPTVDENLVTDKKGTTKGTVAVKSNRKFEIKGVVNTSYGPVETTVEQTVTFSNIQNVDVNPNLGPDDQDLVQSTTVDSTTTTRIGFIIDTETEHLSYPLKLSYHFLYNPDGTYTQVVSSDQRNIATGSKVLNGYEYFHDQTTEEVRANDTLQFDSSFSINAPGIGKTSASYISKDSRGNCYSRELTAANQKLTSVTDGNECKQ